MRELLRDNSGFSAIIALVSIHGGDLGDGGLRLAPFGVEKIVLIFNVKNIMLKFEHF